MNLKTCRRCGNEKEATPENFHKSKKNSDGLHTNCKVCALTISKEHYKANKEEKLKKAKEYVLNNKEKIKAYRREYTEKNKELISAKKKKWYEDNKEMTINRVVKNQRVKRRNNPMIRLNDAIGGGIYKAIKEEKAGRKWEELVGYSLVELKEHIENQFTQGMSWDNYGKWHIDHIIPKASFNFSSPDNEDFKKCWGLTNLQPLWAIDNIRKGARIVGDSIECPNNF